MLWRKNKRSATLCFCLFLEDTGRLERILEGELRLMWFKNQVPPCLDSGTPLLWSPAALSITSASSNCGSYALSLHHALMWCLPTTPSPDPSHLLKQHQMRTPCTSHVVSSCETHNKIHLPLPVCFFTVASPPTILTLPDDPAMPPPEKEPWSALHSLAHVLQQSKTQQFTIHHLPYQETYLDLACLISKYYWP